MLSLRNIGPALLKRFRARSANNAMASWRFWDRLLIVVFAGIIALPGVGSFLGLGRSFDPALESRYPEPPPRFEMQKIGPFSYPTPANLRSFPVMFEGYFKDRHAFRSEAMEAYLWSRVHGFTTVSLESRRSGRDHDAKPGFESTLPVVILGKDGWMFFTGERSIEGYRRVIPLSFEQLERVRLNLEEKQSALKALGIDFMLVIAPDKGTVYPEFLPGYAQPTDRPSRLDQLMGHMRKHSIVRVLDLRPALLNARQQHQVYYKTDSHWNEVGAQAACQSILEALHHPDATNENLDQYRFVEKPSEAGDERRMLGGVGQAETTIVLESRKPRRANVIELIPGDWRSNLLLASTPQAPPITAFVVSDSFHNAVAPFFNEHFQKTYSRGLPTLDGELPFDMIREAKPDIVIHFLVERKLNDIE
jgi:alginate O-acetyltransferase complex protein AlgJ